MTIKTQPPYTRESHRVEAWAFDRALDEPGISKYAPAQPGSDVEMREDEEAIVEIDAGEWLEYDVRVLKAGTYRLDVEIASPRGEGVIEVSFADSDPVRTVDVVETGSWRRYEWMSGGNIELPAGTVRVRFTCAAEGYNFRAFTLELQTGSPPADDAPDDAEQPEHPAAAALTDDELIDEIARRLAAADVAEPQPVPAPEPEPDPMPDPNPQPAPDPEPEPTPAPDPEPAPEPAPPAEGEFTAPLHDNPLADSFDYMPKRLAYRLPKDRIVQIGLDGFASYDPAVPFLDVSRQLAPWSLWDRNTPINGLVFVAENGTTERVEDRRNIPLNQFGLPDLELMEAKGFNAAQNLNLRAGALNDVANDPDWARWIAGRYEVVVEYEAGAELLMTIRPLGDAWASDAVVEKLGDGFMRKTWTVTAEVLRNLQIAVEGGNASQWRRLSIYQTHYYSERTGDRLVETDDRKLHEKGNIYRPRWIKAWLMPTGTPAYNAVRLMDILGTNTNAVTHFDQMPDLDSQQSWTLSSGTLPWVRKYRLAEDGSNGRYPYGWDAHLFAHGDFGMGAPYEAALRLCYEATIEARAAGHDEAIVNPSTFIPQRMEMDEIDKTLDVIAEHVAWASRRGVDYDSVKLELGNEVWNIGGRAFRQDHRYFAGYPKTRYEMTQPLNDYFDPDMAARFEKTDPWYAEPESWAENGLSRSGAMRAQGRRLMHVMARAYARHPQVNWIGAVSTQTVSPAVTRWIMEGAHDGAVDAAKWAAADGAYVVPPMLSDGRYQVGAFIMVDVTDYWQLRGGPDKKGFADLSEDEISALMESGGLADYLANRFLTLPARPQNPEVDRYAITDSLAGFREVIYPGQIEEIKAHGGACISLYESDSHWNEQKDWSEVEKAAHRYFHQRSPEFVKIRRALFDLEIALGFVGIANFDWVTKNGVSDPAETGHGKTGPWGDEANPYAVSPRETAHLGYIAPLVP